MNETVWEYNMFLPGAYFFNMPMEKHTHFSTRLVVVGQSYQQVGSRQVLFLPQQRLYISHMQVL
jgi:hypothetical protein